MRPVQAPTFFFHAPQADQQLRPFLTKASEAHRGRYRPDRDKLSMRRNPPPQPPTVEDCGEEQWDAVQACLGAVKDLRIEHLEMGLGKEAIALITNTIGTLVDKGHLAAAWKLIHMCDRSVRVAVLDSCRPEHVRKLEASNVPKVSEARDLALRTVARKALGTRHSAPDLPLFFRLLPLCSLETRATLCGLFPIPSAEMAMDMDSKVFAEAVSITLKWIDLLDGPACLRELDRLLSTADRIAKSNPANALVLKCLVWPLLTPDRIDRVDLHEHLELCDALRRTQLKAELPTLSRHLLESVPDDLISEFLRVAVAQAANAPNVKESEQRLKELALLADEIGAVLATELNFHLLQAVMQSVHLTDEAAGEGFLKLRQELLGKTDARDMYRNMPVQLKSEFLRLLVEVVVNSPSKARLNGLRALLSIVDDEFDDEFRFYLREAGLAYGSRSWAQLLQGKPTHEISFENSKWAQELQERIAEGSLKEAADLIAAMSNADPKFFDKAAAELFKAVRAQLEAIGCRIETEPLAITLPEGPMSTSSASVVQQMSLVLLASTHPRCTEAAFRILAHKSARLAVLPMLCSDSWGRALESLLSSTPGQEFVARAVIDYLVEGNCSGILVASFFKLFAHRIDLQSVVKAMRAEEASTVWLSMFDGIHAIPLGEEAAYAEHLDEWSPPWRRLMIANTLALGGDQVGAADYLNTVSLTTVSGKHLYPDSELSSHLDVFFLRNPQWKPLTKLLSRPCIPLRGYTALAHALIRRLQDPEIVDKNARRVAWIMVRSVYFPPVAKAIGDDWAVIVDAAGAFEAVPH